MISRLQYLLRTSGGARHQHNRPRVEQGLIRHQPNKVMHSEIFGGPLNDARARIDRRMSCANLYICCFPSLASLVNLITLQLCIEFNVAYISAKVTQRSICHWPPR